MCTKAQLLCLHRLLQDDIDYNQQLACLKVLAIEDVSAEVLVEAVRLFRAHMVRVDVEPAIDLCGTGGDKSGSFNISTTAAFVVAGAGVPVAKHGNVAITSKSGSVDVLRALGVSLPETPTQAQRQFEKSKICFLCAPYFHPAFACFASARRELAAQGIRTIFNLLGPLLNPASVSRATLGTFQPDYLSLLAETLRMVGTERALVFCGHGLDELTLSGTNRVIEVRNNNLRPFTLEAAGFAIEPCGLAELRGGTAMENAAITEAILAGADRGSRRDVVVLNAAAALVTAEAAPTFGDAIQLAQKVIDDGAAYKVLEACRA